MAEMKEYFVHSSDRNRLKLILLHARSTELLGPAIVLGMASGEFERAGRCSIPGNIIFIRMERLGFLSRIREEHKYHVRSG